MIKSRLLGAVCALVFVFGFSTSAYAVLIDFESLAAGTTVTNQFPEVTFSGSSDNVVFDVGLPLGKFICTTGCKDNTILDFTNPVDNLTFWVIQLNTAGKIAEFNIFENSVLTATIDLIGPGTGGGGSGTDDEFIDLSAFSNVTRLEVVNIAGDPVLENGIGLDQFSFDAAVPIPAAVWLFASGLIGLIGIARRKA